MVEDGESALERLAARISDGLPVDWARELAAHPELAARFLGLRRIEAIAAGSRASEQDSPTSELPVQQQPVLPTPGRWGALELRGRLGEGGYGEVWRAYDLALDREVALKLLRPGREGAWALVNEGRRLATVRHPNVLALHGAGENQGRTGIWTEVIHGMTLEEWLARQGTFAAQEAALVGIDLCRALAAVHGAGLVHRDVKTTNVMREDGGRIVLMDFGLVSPQAAPAGDRVQGTPHYLAPELLEGVPPSPATDVYSAGVVLFRLVTGRYPVEAASASELCEMLRSGRLLHLRDLRPDLPAAFVEVVERALERDPARRHASAGEMERALLACVGARTAVPAVTAAVPAVTPAVPAVSATAPAPSAATPASVPRRTKGARLGFSFLAGPLRISFKVGLYLAMGMVIVAIPGLYMHRGASPSARALAGAGAAADAGNLAEARDLYRRAAELSGKGSDIGEAKAGFCGLYDRIAQDPKLALSAKEMLDQCRSWNVGDTGPGRYLELATGLSSRVKDDPALVKGALDSYRVALDRYDKASKADYDSMQAVFAFGKAVFQQAQKQDLEPARRLELYARAEELFDFVDKKDPSLNAFEDMNQARNQRVELMRASQRIDEFNTARKGLLARAAGAEKDPRTMPDAIAAYDEIHSLVLRFQDIKDSVDLESLRAQADTSRDNLQRRLDDGVRSAGAADQVRLLLGQAQRLESSKNLLGARDVYQSLLKLDAGNAEAQGKVRWINDALARSATLKAAARQALAATDHAEAQRKVDELAAIIADDEVARLQTQVAQFRASSDAAAAVAARFRNADALLAGKQLGAADLAYKELLASTTGDPNRRAAEGLRRVREVEVASQVDPKIQTADQLAQAGNVSGAIEVLREAQRINAAYPGLRDRLVKLQAPLIDDAVKSMWKAFEARATDPGRFDQAVRKIRDLDTSNPALQMIQAMQTATSAIAAFKPGEALDALQPYAGDARTRALREQAITLRAAMAPLEAAERAIDAGDKKEAIRQATLAVTSLGSLGKPVLVAQAKDVLARANGIPTTAEEIAEYDRKVEAEAYARAAQEKRKADEAAAAAHTARERQEMTEITQLASAGNWPRAAAQLDQRVARNASVDRAFAAKVFFNASHSLVCDSVCDIPAARAWADKAVAFDPALKPWSAGLAHITGCGFQIQPGCKRMPKR